MDRDSSDEDVDAPPQMALAIVAPQAPGAMTASRRSASISCGKVLDYWAFVEELNMMFEFAVFECLVMKRWTKRQRAAFILYLAGMEEQMRSFMCDPRVITLPFKAVYRGRIRDWDDATCYRAYRFTSQQLDELVIALHLPEYFVLENRAKLRGETVLMVSLYYISTPVTQQETADHFGLTCQPDISRIWMLFESFVYDQFQHLIAHSEDPDDDDELLVWASFIHQFKEAIRNYFVEGIDSSFYRDVICFIDGTRRHVCRPCQRPEDTARGLDTQKKSYNGHKKKHVFGIQSVTAPNGMIIALGKPFRGRRHDSHALTKSRLNAKLAALTRASGVMVKGYGDAAYPRLSNIVKAVGSEDERRVMNRVRTSVEWGFAKVTQKWAGVNFYAKEKIYLNRPAKKYIVAALMTNIHTCLEGSQSSFYFWCRPPSLDSYLGTPARVRE
jgi:hypothetical protein